MPHNTNTFTAAKDLRLGDKLFTPEYSGTHGQRVEVQWIGHHARRARTYVAGLEESSRNPVTLAYDDDKEVNVWREA